jgi:hypothetical protein
MLPVRPSRQPLQLTQRAQAADNILAQLIMKNRLDQFASLFLRMGPKLRLKISLGGQLSFQRVVSSLIEGHGSSFGLGGRKRSLTQYSSSAGTGLPIQQAVGCVYISRVSFLLPFYAPNSRAARLASPLAQGLSPEYEPSM